MELRDQIINSSLLTILAMGLYSLNIVWYLEYNVSDSWLWREVLPILITKAIAGGLVVFAFSMGTFRLLTAYIEATPTNIPPEVLAKLKKKKSNK